MVVGCKILKLEKVIQFINRSFLSSQNDRIWDNSNFQETENLRMFKEMRVYFRENISLPHILDTNSPGKDRDSILLRVEKKYQLNNPW